DLGEAVGMQALAGHGDELAVSAHADVAAELVRAQPERTRLVAGNDREHLLRVVCAELDGLVEALSGHAGRCDELQALAPTEFAPAFGELPREMRERDGGAAS